MLPHSVISCPTPFLLTGQYCSNYIPLEPNWNINTNSFFFQLSNYDMFYCYHHIRCFNDFKTLKVKKFLYNFFVEKVKKKLWKKKFIKKKVESFFLD